MEFKQLKKMQSINSIEYQAFKGKDILNVIMDNIKKILPNSFEEIPGRLGKVKKLKRLDINNNKVNLNATDFKKLRKEIFKGKFDFEELLLL